MIINETSEVQATKVTENFMTTKEKAQDKDGCYPKPLSLEDTTQDNHYLEVNIINSTSNFKTIHWNKNGGLKKQDFYRGKHAYSYTNRPQLLAALIGVFNRIARNCTKNEEQLLSKAVKEKIEELKDCLKFPDKMINRALAHMAKKFPEYQWGSYS